MIREFAVLPSKAGLIEEVARPYSNAVHVISTVKGNDRTR